MTEFSHQSTVLILKYDFKSTIIYFHYIHSAHVYSAMSAGITLPRIFLNHSLARHRQNCVMNSIFSYILCSMFSSYARRATYCEDSWEKKIWVEM